jgi:protoheme IX farnesyltransferase
MNARRQDPTLLRRLAWTGAALTLGLIVLGGVVRITGSGMGCGNHWPLCDGEWFPPLDLPTLIEVAHRWVAALVSLVVLGVTLVAWRRHRGDPRLRNPATLASILLIAQVLLGAVTVKLALPPWVVITHFANAMVLLAALIVTALQAGSSPNHQVAAGGRHSAHGLVVALAGLGFLVILLGSQVANFDAGLLCLGLPLCNGTLLPPKAPLAALHWTHRILAFGFLASVVGVTGWVLGRADPSTQRLRRALAGVLLVTVVQIGIGVAMIAQLLPPTLRAVHLLIGTLLWATLVVLVFVSSRIPASATNQSDSTQKPPVLADLVALTKPRIIALLLVTTLAPMFITPAGIPSLSLVLWVLIGGYLMAGGANAINMWFDRDIDDMMSRTRLRPVPAGRISPAVALGFGVVLGFLAFAVLWYKVNPLSAWLALAGLLFYVFVYTIWLKRSSPQNIVIGGAAGAFPPLVGWTAVTGQLDLAAVYLFAIIFYWTPPHFWALALIKQNEYARAGIPMLPVVRGVRRTKFEMLAYTLILLPLTLMPAFFGALGAFYGVAAFLLGARLVWYCVRLLRDSSVTPAAWKLYRYSLVYLAFLFVAMGVDRAMPFGHRAAAPKIVILDRPEPELVTPTGSHHGH